MANKRIDSTFDEAWVGLMKLGLNYRQAYRAWQIITGHLDKDGWFRKRSSGKPTHYIPHRLLEYGPVDEPQRRPQPEPQGHLPGTGRPQGDLYAVEISSGCGSMPSFDSYEDFEAYAEKTYQEHPDDDDRETEWENARRESEERYRKQRDTRVNNQDQGKKDHISTGELLGAEAKRQRGESKVGQEVAGQGSCGKAGQRGRVEKLHKHPIVPPGEETPESQRAALRRKKRGGQW